MRKNVEKFSKLFICLLALVFVVTCCGCDKKEEPKKENKTVESKVTTLDDQTVEGLKISGLSITYKDGISKIVANVENTTDQTINLTNIGINLYDKNDKLLIETLGYIGESIEPGDNKQIISDVTEDLRSATKVEYKIAR